MATENITISKQSLLKAYREAEPSQREFMKKLFGTEAFTISFNVMERVKTVEDAVQELGEDNKLVAEYQTLYDCNGDNLTPDLLAYLCLRIITAALNEGWEPQFTPDEYRYFPWFALYTKEEYDRLDDDDKKRCVLRPGNVSYSHYLLVGVHAYSASSYSFSGSGARLAFRTRELARYAATQFADIWADFVFKVGSNDQKED